MNEITVDNWKEFGELLLEFDCCRNNLKNETKSHVSEYLFRGQTNFKWKLETTLERFASNKELSFSKYYRFAVAAQPRIETFTGESWPLIPPSEFNQWLSQQKPLYFTGFDQYEYFAYLRHHGFPSPLLDWTMSPYVALFFAFQNTTDSDCYSSVYIYQEYKGSAKTGTGTEPFIHMFGPYAKIHKRHYLQQSCYTFCASKIDSDFIFQPHDTFYTSLQDNQDAIYKINIPSNEKEQILKELNKVNINAFSLMGGVDSLMETTAVIEQHRL